MSWLARAVVCGNLAVALALGCGSDGDATEEDRSPSTVPDAGGDETDDNDGSDGGSGSGGPDSGVNGRDDAGADAAAEDPDLRASCETFCIAQHECIGLTQGDCIASCDAQSEMLEALACAPQGRDENLCLAELSCDELQAYALEGRRAHPQCGEVATAYFEACTRGESQDCTRLCAHYEACDAPSFNRGACEETCLLRAANLEWAGGSACRDAFFDFSGCIADANCEEALAQLTNGATPASCTNAEAAMDEACR